MSLLSFLKQGRAARRFFHNWRDYEKLNHQGISLLNHHFEFDHFFGRVIDMEDTKDKFKVSMKLCPVKPDEVKVDVKGSELTIKGKIEQLKDSNLRISRSFVRKYTLPEDVNPNDLQASINIKEGKLTIEAPKRVIKGPRTGSILIEYV